MSVVKWILFIFVLGIQLDCISCTQSIQIETEFENSTDIIIKQNQIISQLEYHIQQNCKAEQKIEIRQQGIENTFELPLLWTVDETEADGVAASINSAIKFSLVCLLITHSYFGVECTD